MRLKETWLLNSKDNTKGVLCNNKGQSIRSNRLKIIIIKTFHLRIKFFFGSIVTCNGISWVQKQRKAQKKIEDRIKLNKITFSYMNIEGHPKLWKTPTTIHYLFNSNKKHPRLRHEGEPKKNKTYWNYTSFFYKLYFLYLFIFMLFFWTTKQECFMIIFFIK